MVKIQTAVDKIKVDGEQSAWGKRKLMENAAAAITKAHTTGVQAQAVLSNALGEKKNQAPSKWLHQPWNHSQ